MTQIEKQIAEIAKSKTEIHTGSTTISTVAFDLPASAQQQITRILAERRAAIHGVGGGGGGTHVEQIIVIGSHGQK